MRTLIFSVFIMAVSSLTAKEGLGPSFEKLKTRTLLVALYQPDVKYLAKLKDKGKMDEIAAYELKMQKGNEAIRKSFSKFWNLTHSIRFVEFDSVKILTDKFPDKYVYMIVDDGTRNATAKGSNQVYFSITYQVCKLFMPDPKEDRVIAQCRLGNNPSLGDYIYAIYRINDLARKVAAKPEMRQTDVYGIGYDESETEGSQLKDLTLIVRKKDCEEDINLEKVKKQYPYAFKVVSDEEWDNAMYDQRSDVACAVVVLATVTTIAEGGGASMGSILRFQNAVNAKTGHTLCYAMGTDLISPKVLGQFHKFIK